MGTVETVGTNTFTVKGRDGKVVTVDVTTSTTYEDPGVTSPTIANVTTGERVAVEGTTASGTVTATSVFIGAGHGTFGHGTRPAAVGTVGTVGTNTFTVKGRDGKVVTVDVSTSTTYEDPGVTSPTIANVTTGERVAVEGTTASGTVTATSVFIGAGHGTFGHGRSHSGGSSSGSST